LRTRAGSGNVTPGAGSFDGGQGYRLTSNRQRISAMHKVIALLLAVGLGWALLVPGAAARDDRGADAAMQAFIEAMVNKNPQAVLSFFPQKSNFRLVPYEIGSKTPETPVTVSYNQLKNAFAKQGELYVFFFEQPDGWAYQVEFRRGEEWRRGPDAVFFAPQSSMNHTYIKWKQEGDQWVIAEIAYVHP
jgi:hypothetical protein